jgi:hypothetical protein
VESEQHSFIPDGLMEDNEWKVTQWLSCSNPNSTSGYFYVSPQFDNATLFNAPPDPLVNEFGQPQIIAYTVKPEYTDQDRIRAHGLGVSLE